ncbi:MAG TPA: putative collagen-binding domain-containing protein, partial [Sunxiuqinia sp.]|nr:putative collagen-binding domain-containing protein [Sunxiuqinia sp.]
WGSLMAGAAGVEWYFGYRYPNNDLNCENFRSRANWWKQTREALDFFRNYLPFDQMHEANDLLKVKGAWCFADEGNVYAVYLSKGTANQTIKIQLQPGEYSVQWYNPISGGSLQTGSVTEISNGDESTFGLPPSDESQDWVVLIRKTTEKSQADS